MSKGILQVSLYVCKICNRLKIETPDEARNPYLEEKVLIIIIMCSVKAAFSIVFKRFLKGFYGAFEGAY
jgi:hypothetical protein